MIRGTRSLLLLLAASALALGCSDERRRPAPTAQGTSGVVASVTDGDTIRLRSGERVRLVQVDAPEARGDVECWGPQASAAMRRLLRPGDRVTLERDPALDGVDGYGRLLRYVTSPDGTLLNTALVASGDAVPYFFRGDRGRHADRLLAAARSARSDRLGLWGACRRARLTPDLGYRK